jgi:hypothetical protein
MCKSNTEVTFKWIWWNYNISKVVGRNCAMVDSATYFVAVETGVAPVTALALVDNLKVKFEQEVFEVYYTGSYNNGTWSPRFSANRLLI